MDAASENQNRSDSHDTKDASVLSCNRSRLPRWQLARFNAFAALAQRLRAIDISTLSDEEYTEIERVIIAWTIKLHVQKETRALSNQISEDAIRLRKNLSYVIKEYRANVCRAEGLIFCD